MTSHDINYTLENIAMVLGKIFEKAVIFDKEYYKPHTKNIIK